ncbi:hypothetical protein DPX39_000052100 [Trypanosoma brucei equiperdum]|uniref:URB1 C-terminal domain-containing protein n=1 Tax=Trypanosoma brucei equiperdum TaxID=630700 RepID=A0A3L6KR25_9TRYP|nr:hypothetical protein DPX39_000052100 [Trypanosoma brucei equiperdum]
MALVQPLVGHLLSKHNDTVIEGLSKIKKNATDNEGFSTEFLLHPQGFAALQNALYKQELAAPVLQAMTELVKSCNNAGVRSFVLREMCRGPCFSVLRHALSVLSDATLPTTIAALQFASVAAVYTPKVLLSRFGNVVPFHFACFRPQLPYSQRRIRLARAKFLIDLVISSRADVAESVLCMHGFLTHLLEDAGELLQEGTETGVEVAQTALQVFGKRFIDSRIPPAKKRSVLLAQKHTLRLLVKALGHSLVSESVLHILYRTVTELMESPMDFQLMHVDEEDKGMPNRLLFFILKRLRPRNTPAAARLLIFILHQAPGLIRPYFTRASSHLEEESGNGRVSASIGTISTMNVITRAMLAPIPYHLAAGKAKLEPVEARATTFFTMSPAHVAEEVCPPWVAEYVHRMINGSTDLLMLSFALQMTYAILTRAKTVLGLVVKLQEKQGRIEDEESVEGENEDNECDWDAYNAKVQSALLKTVPSWEEFWHRMTQQLHHMMLPPGRSPQEENNGWKPDGKVMFLSQRMFLLMELYSEVFHLRIPWLSALPTRLPVFRPCDQPIVDALRRGEVVVSRWPAPGIAALCSLLVSSLSRGVSMTKMHHITMSSPTGGVQEWPLLLNVVAWAVKHRDKPSEEIQFALAWVARLLQWTVHSVTVRFVCELEEAYLWLSVLNEATLPCFLHMINNLLQRSLSKTADRVTQELTHGEHGVLVNAARTFAAKFDAKTSGKDDGGGDNDIKLLKSGDSGGVKREKNKRDGKKFVKDLWVLDMQENMALFKLVIDRVERKWCNRVDLMREHLHSVFTVCHEEHGKRRIALTFLQAEREQRALQPLHDQVIGFCRTLTPPTLVVDTEEAEVQLLSFIHDCDVREGRQRAKLIRRLSKHSSPTLWCRYPTVCWELSALFLVRIKTRSGERGSDAMSETTEVSDLEDLSQALLQLVVGEIGDITKVLLENSSNEGNTVAFLFLLLVTVWTLLYEHSSVSHYKSSTRTTIDMNLFAPLSVLLLRTYSGTLSMVDRIRYCTLLSMNYFLRAESQSNPLVPDGNDPMDLESTPEESDKSEEADDEGCCGDSRCYDNSAVFSGIDVPQFLTEHRFLIMDHQRAPQVTPEVDMLSLLVDAWTHEEVATAALQCPVRLHNNILLSRRGDVGWELLRAVFPEFSTPKDVELASFDTVVSANVMDPRYLVPLLHTVLAMPAEQLPRRNVGTKCIPVLLRSLSFTDSHLRRMGAAALGSVWTPSGPTRIVVGYTRLKLTQLAAKRERQSGSGSRLERQQQTETSAEWNCPLLPTPISAFLVMAMAVLGDARHPMYHDVMHFLLATKAAFSDPVPLHRFLLSFPLACITTPIMIKRHEDMRNKADKSSMVAASAEGLLDQLRSEGPIHLEFVTRLVEHGCQTCSDMKAILHSESLYSLTMLISMLAAADDIRLMMLRSVHAICTTSTTVGIMAVSDGHILQWLLGFIQQLTAEYGKDVHSYGGVLFMEALCFLQKLASLAFMLPLYGQHVRQQVCIIRRALTVNGVTTKAVLDTVDTVAGQLDGEAELTASGASMLQIRRRKVPFRGPTNGHNNSRTSRGRYGSRSGNRRRR